MEWKSRFKNKWEQYKISDGKKKLVHVLLKHDGEYQTAIVFIFYLDMFKKSSYSFITHIFNMPESAPFCNYYLNLWWKYLAISLDSSFSPYQEYLLPPRTG